MSVVKRVGTEYAMTYLAQLALHPLRTKAITGAITAGTGDLLGQLVWPRLVRKDTTKKLPSFNWRRSATFIVYGMIISSYVHFWYQLLDRISRGRKGAVLLRIILDQAISAPLTNSFFVLFVSICSGYSFDAALKRTKEVVPEQLVQHWRLWIPAQYINFKHVPPPLRVLFGNFVALFWNTYLSIRNNNTIVDTMRVPHIYAVYVNAAASTCGHSPRHVFRSSTYISTACPLSLCITCNLWHVTAVPHNSRTCKCPPTASFFDVRAPTARNLHTSVLSPHKYPSRSTRLNCQRKLVDLAAPPWYRSRDGRTEKVSGLLLTALKMVVNTAYPDEIARQVMMHWQSFIKNR
ncbi:hypothetical protein PROFUN_11484 [Planoprotostelium fungivorum]|uniref:Uncharacterized protein n=1 Tax=Planoprotostelium fungivorum TaxID=1890364 RepID=A0A2P6N9V8_9EUKA|nr:hypothetical protein PROFUN_11484 [Planoprotostelium fungivorum]